MFAYICAEQMKIIFVWYSSFPATIKSILNMTLDMKTTCALFSLPILMTPPFLWPKTENHFTNKFSWDMWGVLFHEIRKPVVFQTFSSVKKWKPNS